MKRKNRGAVTAVTYDQNGSLTTDGGHTLGAQSPSDDQPVATAAGTLFVDPMEA